MRYAAHTTWPPDGSYTTRPQKDRSPPKGFSRMASFHLKIGPPMGPPKNISHYEIVEKLGEGGMGVVYKALDRKLNRYAALKFLSSHRAASEGEVARFHHDARAISALNHPNIATIYEIDELSGQCFL